MVCAKKEKAEGRVEEGPGVSVQNKSDGGRKNCEEPSSSAESPPSSSPAAVNSVSSSSPSCTSSPSSGPSSSSPASSSVEGKGCLVVDKKADKQSNKSKEASSGGRADDAFDPSSLLRYGNRFREEESNDMHLFWDTQPVPKMNQVFTNEDRGPIDPIKTVDDVRKEPYKLPPGYVWKDCDVRNDAELDEIYHLLYDNYVEDDDSMFRFDYSREFIRWAITPPHYLQEWHCAVRVESTNKMVGFITGIPARVHVNGDEIDVAEINFLCVHKKLRSKRLAPVLIKEITRRVNITGKWQAVYTAGAVLPKPVARCQYWHRSLNPKKLVEVGFSSMGPRMTMSRTIRLYRVNETPRLPGLRRMEEKDVSAVHTLVNDYLKRYRFRPVLSKEECAHWFLPKKNAVYSYVRTNENGKVVDFLSFYSLPSTVIKKDKYSSVYAAYAYYNIATSVDLKILINDALTLAKNEGFDVYNALDVMENESFLTELKFGKGDGYLQYYLYNWKCPELKHSDVGLVLL